MILCICERILYLTSLTLQVHEAYKSMYKEFKILFNYIYNGFMLFLWLWYPKFSRSTARALGGTIGIQDCVPSDDSDINDSFMVKLFSKNQNVMRKLWNQLQIKPAEVQEIIKMSHLSCSHFTQNELAQEFPALDLLIFLSFDALCTANHFIEGSFSNKGQLLRDNISDERLDRKARYRQNESHPVKKEVMTKATARMQSKGCKHTASTAIGTRGDVQEFIRGHLRRLNSGYSPEDFKIENGCPSNNSHRNSATGQITANDRWVPYNIYYMYIIHNINHSTAHSRSRARETVRVQKTWAVEAGRKDSDDSVWDAAAAATANPNLELFKTQLEEIEHAASLDGRCEKALSRILHPKTWSGSVSYCSRSAFTWIW